MKTLSFPPPKSASFCILNPKCGNNRIVGTLYSILCTPYENRHLNLSYTNTLSRAKRRFQTHKSSFRWTICLRALQVYGRTLIWGHGRRGDHVWTGHRYLTHLGFKSFAYVRNITDVGRAPHGRCGRGRGQKCKNVQNLEQARTYGNSPAIHWFHISRNMAFAQYFGKP